MVNAGKFLGSSGVDGIAFVDSFLKDFADVIDELLRVQRVFNGLMLHVAEDALPLAQFKVLPKVVVAVKTFDRQTERLNHDVPEAARLLEAPVEMAALVMKEAFVT